MAERIKAPPPFEAKFAGPEGTYKVAYKPVDDWDGRVSTSIGGIDMIWPVDLVEIDEGILRVCGLTHGTEEVWNDVFWFEIICESTPRKIRYWGDRVIHREDLVEER